MVLSLLPQTVLALDPDQRQAERREGYDVATVHYTDANGDEQAIPFTETGSGYVYTLPQGVADEQVTVEYFSTTRWDGAVDISWYNDTDREFTLTNPAQLAGLSQTGAVGYQYWKKDTENLVTATKYVTLETLLKAAGADFTPGMPGTPATCTESGLTDGQLCLICGQVYGQEVIPAAGHTPELRDAKEAGCTQDGYTGDTYCAVCGELLARGQVIPAKGHDYQDGKCTVCGAEDPDYQPEQPTQPENPGVKTGDESYVVLWSAALLLGGAALVLLPRKKRS